MQYFSQKSLEFKIKDIPLQPQTRNNGAIAQLVEQRTENPCVPGSIPGGTTDNQAVTLICSCFFLYISTCFSPKLPFFNHRVKP